MAATEQVAERPTSSSSISVQVVEVLAAAADFELLVRINFYKYQKTVPHYLLGQSGLVC